MGFLDFFRIKKEVPPKSITSTPRLEPIQKPPLNIGKPITGPVASLNRNFKKVPEDLPKFPIDMPKNILKKEDLTGKGPSFNFNISKIDESTTPLPRVESESSVKDFISSESRKPFIPKFEEVQSTERVKPPTLDKLEGDFKAKPLFRGEIRSVDKTTRFDLHDIVRKPLFIRTDQYKDVKKNMVGLKETLKELDEIYYRMTNLKEDQDSQFDSFHKKIEEVQRKLIHIDKTIFEKGDEN